MLSQEILKQTPLYEEHLKLHAKMVPFAGWEMPLQYEGILAEYVSTRQQLSIFDTSHMGEFLIQGDYQASGMDHLICFRLADMPLKSCRYGMMLNPQGGVIDDLIVYRIAFEEWMVVVNAATMEKDARHFIQHLTPQAVFNNVSAATGKLDIQGPWSQEILSRIIVGLRKLNYYTFDYFDVLGERVIVSRTGYTGELGYEIYFPWERLPELWREIFKNPKVKPAGLGVRDVLRIEMGYSLYGHELDETISPLEAGLAKFVDFDKDFLGRDALVEQKSHGCSRKMVYFNCDSRRSPRSHYVIYSPKLEDLGVVTSGTFSPSLQKGIGMGFLWAQNGSLGEKILVGDQKNKIEAHLRSRPFYKSGSLKN